VTQLSVLLRQKSKRVPRPQQCRMELVIYAVTCTEDLHVLPWKLAPHPRLVGILNLSLTLHTASVRIAAWSAAPRGARR